MSLSSPRLIKTYSLFSLTHGWGEDDDWGCDGAAITLSAEYDTTM